MAGRIQGITVELSGDSTKLQTALKGVNTEIRNTQSQLRDVINFSNWIRAILNCLLRNTDFYRQRGEN